MLLSQLECRSKNGGIRSEFSGSLDGVLVFDRTLVHYEDVQHVQYWSS